MCYLGRSRGQFAYQVHTIDVYLVSDCISAKETFGTSKSKSSILEPVTVFSDDMESHIAHLRRILSRLQVLLFLEPAEDTSEISSLGLHVIRKDGAVVTTNSDCLAITVHV